MLQLRRDDRDRGMDGTALEALPDLVDAFALSVLSASPDCIKLVELDGSLTFMNQNGIAAMEIDAFGNVEGRRWSDLWPQESRETVERAIGEAAEGRSSVFEAFCPTAKGADRWWSVTVAPIAGDDGRARRILATSRDITERVEAERVRADQETELKAVTTKLAMELAEKTRLLEQQKILRAEIDHRVKNSFALISGILRLQMRTLSGGEAREAIEDAANRISTLAKLHEQLHLHPDEREIALGPYLASLVAGLSDTLGSGRSAPVELEAGIESTASTGTAVSIGLVTTELVANALKHPRPGETNHVRVSLRSEPSGMTELVVTDTGLGLPPGFDPAQSEGLGMKICAIYAQQLGGEMTCGNRLPAGAEFRVRFDLRDA